MASLPLLFPSSHYPSPFPSPRFSRKTNWVRRKLRIRASHENLQPFYDDGYGDSRGIVDFLDVAADLVKSNDGPPRWFCPIDCGPPLENSPLLLFLPGIDGIGQGLFMHHKALGRFFEVRCMHVPFTDRTPFEGLVSSVEDILRLQHSTCENRPIYLVGNSFGGCLALSVAARNPNIDLILILSNPATSFHKSQLQQLFPLFERSFYQLYIIIPFLLSFNIDNHVKAALESTADAQNPLAAFDKLSRNFFSPLLHNSNILDSISKETVSWKLKLLESAASYANSRLHAVKAEVLVLASCLDHLLPSKDEAKRLVKSLFNCKVHYFQNYGHNIFMESGFHLCSLIKRTELYRRSRQHDYVSDYLPLTMTELEEVKRESRALYQVTSPVMFSTMEDGKIVRGLSGVPSDGPVLLVGNHMLLGIEMISLVVEFLKEKRIIHGLGHPGLFIRRSESFSEGRDFFDHLRLVGTVPVSYRNFYKLLLRKSFVLLYPGGSRESLHRKGEEYKLFWPTQPEFVRMAARFGATIVPFGVVGEDDIAKVLLDYNDIISIPFVREMIKEANQGIKIRNNEFGVRDQDLFMPLVAPKIPGRFYHLFGKPITLSRSFEERENANAMYLHIKSETEKIISYLLKKREEDVYRSIFQRILYQATRDSSHQIPTFDP